MGGPATELSDIRRVVPADTEYSEGEKVFAPRGATKTGSELGGPATGGWAFVKKNIPSILSILSVMTNAIILSALIPSMKQDIAYMQGQTQAIQSQVNSWYDKIEGANTAVSQFNGNLASINSSIVSAEAASARAQQKAADTLFSVGKQTSELEANITVIIGQAQHRANQTLLVVEKQTSDLEANITIIIEQAQQRATQTLLSVEKQTGELEANITTIVGHFQTERDALAGEIQSAKDVGTQLSSQAAAAMASISQFNSTLQMELQAVLEQQGQQAQSVLAGFRSANASYFSGFESLSSEVEQIGANLSTSSSVFSAELVVLNQKLSDTALITDALHVPAALKAGGSSDLWVYAAASCTVPASYTGTYAFTWMAFAPAAGDLSVPTCTDVCSTRAGAGGSCNPASSSPTCASALMAFSDNRRYDYGTGCGTTAVVNGGLGMICCCVQRACFVATVDPGN